MARHIRYCEVKLLFQTYVSYIRQNSVLEVISVKQRYCYQQDIII